MNDRYADVAREMLAISEGVPLDQLEGLLGELYHWREQQGGKPTPLVAALIEAFEGAVDHAASVAGP